MKNRWQASKIGLINFWYYDEQEFPFVKGRMLLRGSNGSGKSVTMQSVVPLLLDGNMSPERLDPFGSRDRKMSSYLLEEDDGREERTGYLYLEFKRQETDNYLTIGMGIRARRGKPLDKWYFSLTDGRRIGQDFFLYKQTDEKVTLSKKELEYRVAEGGQVFDKQAEYMEYVNRQIFGFDTVEEYKEMIDLLIQLRTPKLSKDFKPSVINDILSDSLQPLSDEDLRPMSEAIENMDTMNMNLKSRQEARQAAEKIKRVYDKYNQITLYEKADSYEKIQEDLENLRKQAAERKNLIELCNQEIQSFSQQLEQMKAKQEAMEKERESLSKSDALHLKQRQAELEMEILTKEQTLQVKEKSLQAKEEQHVDLKKRQKEEENRKFEKEQNLQELLEEMQDDADTMSFEEHSFFEKEFRDNFEEVFSFATHEKQFLDTKEKIKQGVSVLRETEHLKRQADELIQQREQFIRELDAIHKKIVEREMLLVQSENEWKEALYQWNDANKELALDKEQLRFLAAFADSYEEQPDFAKVKAAVSDIWISRKNELEIQKNQILEQKKQCEKEQEETKAELLEWQNEKEPEPLRTEAVIKNRQRLEKLQIPYQEFYKVIEFGGGLSEAECNRLEEALLQMGILDALVIEEQYKEQVLKQENGCEDRYLFVQKSHAGHSLLDVLELNDNVNDIFSNQRLTGILSNIAYGEAGVTAVSKDGTYQLGVLTGTVTGEHVAEFLGTRARERSRQAKIENCMRRLEELSSWKESLEAEENVFTDRINTAEKEYKSLPVDKDLRTALNMLLQERSNLEQKKQQSDALEIKWKELSQKLNEQQKEAVSIAEKLYLSCNYDVFCAAEKAAENYQSCLVQVKGGHELYLQTRLHLLELTEDLENIDADLEDIRYDLSNTKRELERKKQEYASVTEQLGLTDYEQIKERLDTCIKWLQEYPKNLQNCIEARSKREEQVNNLQAQVKEAQEKESGLQQKNEWRKKCFEAELALSYVALPEELSKDAKSLCTYLENDTKSRTKDAIIADLNRVYFENRSFLNEYQVMQSELFTELEEERPQGEKTAVRQDFTARYQGTKIPFAGLLAHLDEDIAELNELIKDGDRELFEDILANTVSRKIRGKINASNAWVEKMNALMGSMNTSSGLKLSLKWRSKTAESEDQLDTNELVDLLKKDYRLMSEEEAERLSKHFRSKVEEARRHAKDSLGMVSFYQVMKDTLDYRKWFEFQLFSQKKGERVKELTNSVFGTFSGGEKAMSMYVPLFSAVVAKYQGGREDAPRLISLDEAFAGVDNRNIRDMFRLMTEFSFDFIINSQVLWGDCDTLDALAIYQLLRPENAKFVTVMPYLWNGNAKELLNSEEEVEQRGAELGREQRA